MGIKNYEELLISDEEYQKREINEQYNGFNLIEIYDIFNKYLNSGSIYLKVEIYKELKLVRIIGFHPENNYDLHYIPIPNDDTRKMIFNSIKNILKNNESLNIGLLYINNKDKDIFEYIGENQVYIVSKMVKQDIVEEKDNIKSINAERKEFIKKYKNDFNIKRKGTKEKTI